MNQQNQKIQQIQIQGYRSLKDVTWKPGQLNVVIGPNGTGKSNLLRALELLTGSAMGNLPKDILRQGGIASLLWDGQTQELAWQINVSPMVIKRIEFDLAYTLQLQQLGTSSSYRIEKEVLGPYRQDHQQPHPVHWLERHATIAKIHDRDPKSKTPLIPIIENLPEQQTLMSRLESPAGTARIWQFREYLTSWGIYHDLRVDQDAVLRQAAVARIEKRIAADGQNLIPVLHTLYSSDRNFKQEMDAAMRAAFGEDFEEIVFPPAADQRVQLRLRWRSLQREQSAADLSDGTLRFMLLIAILANPEPGALIAIDEPETGLHPGMLPIVAEFAQQAADRCQVILTTHSPQILDAFGAQPPTTTVAHWAKGETKLSVIDGGELKRWLKNYSLGSLFRSGELEIMV